MLSCRTYCILVNMIVRESINQQGAFQFLRAAGRNKTPRLALRGFYFRLYPSMSGERDAENAKNILIIHS